MSINAVTNALKAIRTSILGNKSLSNEDPSVDPLDTPDKIMVFKKLITNIKWHEARKGYRLESFNNWKKLHAWQALGGDLEFSSLGKFIKNFVDENEIQIDLSSCKMGFIPNF